MRRERRGGELGLIPELSSQSSRTMESVLLAVADVCSKRSSFYLCAVCRG